MPRFTREGTDGEVVSGEVSEETAALLGADYVIADEKKAPAKKASSSKSDK